MRFRFPIVIIDEDFRSENASGLGIRALAKAIEAEGVEALGVTSFGDVASFAQQQSRASGFILSVDDEELAEGNGDQETVAKLLAFVREIRRRNADIPIFLYGETRTTQHLPNEVLRELHGFIHMFEDTPEFVARYIVRESHTYLDTLHHRSVARALRADGSSRGTARAARAESASLKSPVGQMFHQFSARHAAGGVCNSVGRTRQLLGAHRAGRGDERDAARIFGAESSFFVTNGTSTSDRVRLALRRRAGRRGDRRPQLPQVDPACDHDDGATRCPDPTRDHSDIGRPAGRISSRSRSRRRSSVIR